MECLRRGVIATAPTPNENCMVLTGQTAEFEAFDHPEIGDSQTINRRISLLFQRLENVAPTTKPPSRTTSSRVKTTADIPQIFRRKLIDHELKALPNEASALP